ncbi:hypothetical protein M885DRAFT_506795 [Pelagophyceae sp. CCMP2097]|nr:hypothetical protein M885DRAFT_506795 [Pelagophyceae sp. CCMP2097]
MAMGWSSGALRALERWTELGVHVLLVSISLASNCVRHDGTKIPRTATPRSAYLTVHTIAIELAYLGCNALESACRCTECGPPRWLSRAAHRYDVFVLTLGAVLWIAYYGLVHAEIRASGDAEYIRFNNVIHAPTLVLPMLCAAAKPHSLHRRHGAARWAANDLTAACATYAAAYVAYVEVCAFALARRGVAAFPYAFLAKLGSASHRMAFWCFGTLAVLGLAQVARAILGRFARRRPRSVLRRHAALATVAAAVALLPWRPVVLP